MTFAALCGILKPDAVCKSGGFAPQLRQLAHKQELGMAERVLCSLRSLRSLWFIV